MYNKNEIQLTDINVNTSYKGETIEEKIRRITTQNEPIKDGAPLIYTDRKNGVGAEYNIRTDRFEVAIDAMDAVSRNVRAKRDGLPKSEDKPKELGDGKAEPIGTTD